MPVRFSFCGDDEVPDWILACLYGISAIDVNVLKLIAQTATDSILQEEYTIENDNKLTLPDALEKNKRLLAAILFIIQNSVSNDTAESTLSNELQQIGFPHEHAIILCKTYTENIARLKSKAKQLSLRCSIPKSTEVVKDGNNIVLNMQVWQAETNSQENYSLSVTKEQVHALLEELKSVYEKIDSLA